MHLGQLHDVEAGIKTSNVVDFTSCRVLNQFFEDICAHEQVILEGTRGDFDLLSDFVDGAIAVS